jgi:hypothetical protein
MTSSPHGPYIWGDTHATMAPTMRRNRAIGSQSHKRRLSADRGLKLALVKAELLVTAHQQWCGECVPGPCTHRPSRHGSRQRLKSVGQPVETRGAAAEGGAGDWDEVVTR